MSTEERAADVVVLGGGSGGYSCALRAAQLGMAVLLVERDRLGGTCLHRGCIPTKALLHAAEVAEHARHGSRVGVLTELTGIDMAGVRAYSDGVVGALHTGLTGLLRSRGVEVVTGSGTMVGPRTVEVDGARLIGRHLVLATGSRPRSLPGLAPRGPVLTSDGALALDRVPGRAVVLGGGVVGVEFASVWRSFGTEVTVVEAAPRLLPGEDAFVSDQLERAFRRRGIDVRTGVRLDGSTVEDDRVLVTLTDGTQIEADVLLVAVGREPATDGNGFAESGVTLDRGVVVTDERLRTGVGPYAVGDLVAGPQLAHRGFQQGVFVADDIAGLSPVPIPDESIPRVTYCEPEVASVGLTERQARDRHGEIETVTYDLGGNGRSRILRTRGAIKVVKAGAAGTDGPVVGIHMVGSRVGELIGEAQLICAWAAYPGDVAPHVHAHPTQNEALGEAMLALAGTPLHTHG